MTAEIVETRTLFYQVLPRRPINKFVVGLRKDQVEYLDDIAREDKARGLVYKQGNVKMCEHLGNAGFISPKNIKSYECLKCQKIYEEPPPKTEVRVSDIVGSDDAHVGYFCPHCNEWLAEIPMFSEEDMKFIEKEYITKDYTGKIVPFSQKFIDIVLEETKHYGDYSHMIYRFEHDIEKVRGWANSIGYDINAKLDIFLPPAYEKAFLYAVSRNNRDYPDYSFSDAVYLFKKIGKPPTPESAKAFQEWLQEVINHKVKVVGERKQLLEKLQELENYKTDVAKTKTQQFDIETEEKSLEELKQLENICKKVLVKN